MTTTTVASLVPDVGDGRLRSRPVAARVHAAGTNDGAAVLCDPTRDGRLSPLGGHTAKVAAAHGPRCARPAPPTP